MKLFLDSSVLLSASGSTLGASFALFSHADRNNWVLLSSPYVFAEVTRNLPKLPATAATEWFRLCEQMRLVDDVFSLDRPVVFEASKDRPVLFTALASADALLTLDKKDFASVMGKSSTDWLCCYLTISWSESEQQAACELTLFDVSSRL